MNPSASRMPAIALFGGVFDPIHVGHLAVAQAACRRFHLDRVYFIPSGHPPHKASVKLTAFEHRYAMVSLACAGRKRFIPSLAETGASGTERIFYTIDTVRRFRRSLAGTSTRLFFIVGADAFLQIRTWKDYRRLLGACEFIVAHRPGFGLEEAEARGRKAGGGPLGATHLLHAVSSEVSSTEIRLRRRQGRSIRGLVPAPVGDYIEKQALYGK